MPIYEYQCSKCNHHLEVIQKMSDDALKECPECHQPCLTKLVSAAGFQLKGTGWYATDYKSSNKTTSGAKSTETATTDTSSKGDSSTDGGTAS